MLHGVLRRRAGVAAVFAFCAAWLLPSAVSAGEIENYWDGGWTTHHTGVHAMFLKLDQKKGEREVTGTFRHKNHDGSEGSRGTIKAEALNSKGTALEGKYKDTKNGSSKGFFRLHLEKNDISAFEGKFGLCKWWKPWCDEPTYEWTGVHN